MSIGPLPGPLPRPRPRPSSSPDGSFFFGLGAHAWVQPPNLDMSGETNFEAGTPLSAARKVSFQIGPGIEAPKTEP